MFLSQAFTRARWPAAALGMVALVANMRWLDALERKLIFAPPQTGYLDSTQFLPAERESCDVWIPFVSACTGLQVQLHGQWLPHPNAQAPALLLLHGARADIKRSAERIQHLCELGFSVLAIDYRGFGKSGREELPSEATSCEDARAAWQWLAQQQPHHARYVFGHSLGGAIAIDLAASIADASGLIVDSSFTSMDDVVKGFGWSTPQVLRRITQHFDAVQKIARVRAPVLVVHGDRDDLIPAEHGRSLWENATARKRFVLVRGGSHHNTLAVGRTLYACALRELFGLST